VAVPDLIGVTAARAPHAGLSHTVQCCNLRYDRDGDERRESIPKRTRPRADFFS